MIAKILGSCYDCHVITTKEKHMLINLMVGVSLLGLGILLFALAGMLAAAIINVGVWVLELLGF